jgi:hypothetical protein
MGAYHKWSFIRRGMIMRCGSPTTAMRSNSVARITDEVKAGIVVATMSYWRQLNEGTVNSISSGAFTDTGYTPSFSDNLVEIARAN